MKAKAYRNPCFVKVQITTAHNKLLSEKTSADTAYSITRGEKAKKAAAQKETADGRNPKADDGKLCT